MLLMKSKQECDRLRQLAAKYERLAQLANSKAKKRQFANRANKYRLKAGDD
jgi:hypothetical protein